MEYIALSRKYSNAKRLIFSLKEAGNVLKDQLITRDAEYSVHLAKLRYTKITGQKMFLKNMLGKPV